MKTCRILLSALCAAVVLCGCAAQEKQPPAETVRVCVVCDREALPATGYDIMAEIDGASQSLTADGGGYTLVRAPGELRGTVKYPDWVEVEYGFIDDGSLTEIAIEVSLTHTENGLNAVQTVTALRGGEPVSLTKEASAPASESSLSVFSE